MESSKSLKEAAVGSETSSTTTTTTTMIANNRSSEISELGADVAVSNNGVIQTAQEDGYPSSSDTETSGGNNKTLDEEEKEDEKTQNSDYTCSDSGSEEQNMNEVISSISSNVTSSTTSSSTMIDSSALKRMGVRQLKPSYKNNSYQPLFVYQHPFFMPVNYAAPLSPEPEQVKSSTNLYIRGLVEDFTDEDLVDMCKQYGPIKSTKSILDKKTGKCKGYGFVDFERPEDAQRGLAALLANGITAEFANLQEQDPTNLYISNLPKMFTEKNLQNLVSPYGNIISSRILREPNGYSRGVGFVRLDSREDCLKAIEKLHDRPLPGCVETLAVKLADSGNYRKRSTSFQGWTNDIYNHSNPFDIYLQYFTTPNFSGDSPVFHENTPPSAVLPLVPSNNSVSSAGKAGWHQNGIVGGTTTGTQVPQLQQYIVPASFPGYNQVQGHNIPHYFYSTGNPHAAVTGGTVKSSSNNIVHHVPATSNGSVLHSSTTNSTTHHPITPPYHHPTHPQYNTPPAPYHPTNTTGLAPNGISAGPHHTAHYTSQYPQGWTITPNHLHHHYPTSQHP